MAGYAENVAEEKKKESNFLKLEEGTIIVRVLPPNSSYFDPQAAPLDYFYFEKRTIWDFPLKTGPKNIVVNKHSLVKRAVRAYQLTLGDFEAQKRAMKSTGMDRFWDRQRGVLNVITAEKQDRPYWLELPKTALEQLSTFIKADPSIIDLDEGRFIKLTITGTGRTNKKYSLEVSKKPSAVKLKFEHSLLDELKEACTPTEVAFSDIQEPTIRKYAMEILQQEKEDKQLEQQLASPNKPSLAVEAVADDSFSQGFESEEEPEGFSATGFDDGEAEDAAGFDGSSFDDTSEEDDLASFRAELEGTTSTEDDDGFGSFDDDEE